VNNILIFLKNPFDHRKHVAQMLEKLRNAGLQTDIKKNEFLITRTKFLEYIISTQYIAVNPDKMSAITQ
jgi:hypothetical protein